jgi:hypothetical protein
LAGHWLSPSQTWRRSDSASAHPDRDPGGSHPQRNLSRYCVVVFIYAPGADDARLGMMQRILRFLTIPLVNTDYRRESPMPSTKVLRPRPPPAPVSRWIPYSGYPCVPRQAVGSIFISSSGSSTVDVEQTPFCDGCSRRRLTERTSFFFQLLAFSSLWLSLPAASCPRRPL